MNRDLNPKYLLDAAELKLAGIELRTIAAACNHTHAILDLLDGKLLESGSPRLSEMIELANLSSFVGNLLGAGIAKFSMGNFERNGPHKYPDLIGTTSKAKDIEIKVALEAKKPKGHLAKAGFYLICRYVLVQDDGSLDIKNRGSRVCIWEIRFGYLDESHFNLSNTPGDSGKTAVVNSEGMVALKLIYCDLDRCPMSRKGKTYKDYAALFT